MKMIRITFLTALIMMNILQAQERKEDNHDEEEYFQPVEEFFITESVYPQEQFEIQFTFSPILNSESGDEKYKFPFSFEYGITDQFQIESGIETSARSIGFPESADEFEIGLKYSFMNINKKNIHAAFSLEAEFPINEEEENIRYTPSLIFAYDLLSKYNMQIFSQFSYNIINNNDDNNESEEEASNSNLDLNSGFFISLGEITIVNEFSIQTIAEESNSELYFVPGIIYETPPGIEIGAAASIGLNDYADSFKVILSFVYEL